MVDRIDKSLGKLSPKERAILLKIIQRIAAGDTLGMDMKKLKGVEDVYRVRKGSMRVIFRRMSDGIKVLAVEPRNDTTYNSW